ncbi:TPA: hypothetical protein ACPX8S_000154 [Streptococcus pneumoniae]|uniref:hypothetical protein n=1 Tax=Streptococcus pneumoniae TaxID=1313 RepID=UPI0010DF2988|nr:hypothetical protein [Streptococcus pneumoniae]VIT22478.1 chlorohydrolase [Streptococcus pneumoniae]VJB69177.1 chlorohydrolase [Streptococcus pneumoniae]VJD09225.1 chlorohydrolase [Streptococcus pneumoniae]VJH67533.1 chlorohydrolase [Streptococcus pneumoniae]
MKIKEQTRKLAVGYSKHCFEVVDRTDEVSNHTHGKATLTWFEEIFEEYKHFTEILSGSLGWQMTFPVKNGKIRKNNLRIEEKRCKKRFW